MLATPPEIMQLSVSCVYDRTFCDTPIFVFERYGCWLAAESVDTVSDLLCLGQLEILKLLICKLQKF